MKNRIKLAALLLAMVLAAVPAYSWGTLSLGSRIPDRDWVIQKLYYENPETPEQAEVFDISSMPEVLERIRVQRVLRSGETEPVPEESYRVVLEDAHGTSVELQVEKSGQVRLLGTIPQEQWGCWRSGSALHIYLANVRLLLQTGIDRVHG